ncbi:class I adenylate-forming enzyme family protein [Rhodococcus zopfii]|uniref:Long-chain fatty acid--CoA ligase n=1 Tax=Rhodococcus zopfii TaxID=43772 RepID=A0ABU3WPK9_9NOCA|nr:long-chain fatty acid--CoA ligase [Rhodococcus zopfii]
MTLAVDLIRRGAALHADRIAVRYGDDRLTFREVNEAANRFAAVFAELGIVKGTHLAILSGNGLWTVAVDFACMKAGIVRVPLNARLSVTEHKRMIDGTRAQFLLHDAALTEPAEQLRGLVDGLIVIGLGASAAGGGIDLLDTAENASTDEPHVEVAADDPVLLLHTSGTTGVLKAATHTQASWAGITRNILSNLISPAPDSVMLHAASMIHASGTFVLPYWVRGGTTAILDKFEPEGFLQAIERYRATEINLVPTMIGMLFASPALDSADVSSLRTVIYGASPMPRPLIRQAMDRWGSIFVQYYGQTEIPLALTVLTKEDHQDPSLLGSCGQPCVDADIRLIGDDGTPVEPGRIGEFQARMPSRMLGYHNAAELNAEMITEDGWIRTRDMAYVDERGYYHLVDRSSDMIVSGGYNVYPREVEDALSEHPAVAECAVVGAPDPLWVEAVTAFVAFRPGMHATEKELQQTVRGRLAGYKVPKRIHVTDTIPKSAVGKILRRALREPLWSREVQA